MEDHRNWMKAVIKEWYGYGRFSADFLNSLTDRQLLDMVHKAKAEEDDLRKNPNLWREIAQIAT